MQHKIIRYLTNIIRMKTKGLSILFGLLESADQARLWLAGKKIDGRAKLFPSNHLLVNH